MSSRNNGRRLHGVIPAILFVTVVAACAEPDFYLDRRDTVTFHAGDAVAANIITQAADPWPRVAANRNIYGNGERVQGAIERYRTNKVTPLRSLSTSSVEFTPTDGGSGLTK